MSFPKQVSLISVGLPVSDKCVMSITADKTQSRYSLTFSQLVAIHMLSGSIVQAWRADNPQFTVQDIVRELAAMIQIGDVPTETPFG